MDKAINYVDLRKEFTQKAREIISELLPQLTDTQVGLFNKLYGSVDKIKLNEMPWAYSQVKNSIVKNINGKK